jgi:photosystem II stability/assembly factor-like uncharacterized protein
VNGPASRGHGRVQAGEAGHTLTDVRFTSDGDGWVVGGIVGGGYGVTQLPAWLAHTIDGGATWQEVPDTTYREPWIAGVVCEGATCVTVSQTFTQSSLVLTTDGGQSWTAVDRFDRQVFALACSPDFRTCLAAGGGKGAPPRLASRASESSEE